MVEVVLRPVGHEGILPNEVLQCPFRIRSQVALKILLPLERLQIFRIDDAMVSIARFPAKGAASLAEKPEIILGRLGYERSEPKGTRAADVMDLDDAFG